MENHFKDEHAHITDRIPDSVDIILARGHQFSGVGFVKIIRAQRLYMGKKRSFRISVAMEEPIRSKVNSLV